MRIKASKPGIQCITVWERSKKEFGHYEFNHITTDWEEYNYPDAVNEAQRKEWANWYWRKTFATLENGHVNINGGQNLLFESIETLLRQRSRLSRQLNEFSEKIQKVGEILER